MKKFLSIILIGAAGFGLAKIIGPSHHDPAPVIPVAWPMGGNQANLSGAHVIAWQDGSITTNNAADLAVNIKMAMTPGARSIMGLGDDGIVRARLLPPVALRTPAQIAPQPAPAKK